MSYRRLHEYEWEEQDDELHESDDDDGDGGDGEEDSGDGDGGEDQWGGDEGGGDWEASGDWADSGGDDFDGGESFEPEDDFSRDFDGDDFDDDDDFSNDGDSFIEREQRRRERQRQQEEFERQQREEEERVVAEAYRQQQEELERQAQEQREMLDEPERQQLAEQEAQQSNWLQAYAPDLAVTDVPIAQVPDPLEPGEQREPEYDWDTDDPAAWVAVRRLTNMTDGWIRRSEFNPRFHRPIRDDLPSLGPRPVGNIAHATRRDPSRPPPPPAPPEYDPQNPGDVQVGNPPSVGARQPVFAPPPLFEPGEGQVPRPVFAPPPPFSPGDRRVPDAAAADAAASAAAEATAATGADAQTVANAAAQAAVRALDRQTLAQQTPWTQQAFRSRYGAGAEDAWLREHTAELQRNQRIYGSLEPRPGTEPLAGIQAPPAPNRQIGATPPPAPGTPSRFGINRAAPAITTASTAPTLAPRVPGTAGATPPASAPGAAPPATESSVLPGNLPRYTPPAGYERTVPGETNITQTRPGTPDPANAPGVYTPKPPPVIEPPSRGNIPSLQPPAPVAVPEAPAPEPAPLPTPPEPGLGVSPYDETPPSVPPSPATAPVTGQPAESPTDWIDLRNRNPYSGAQSHTVTRSEWDALPPSQKAQWEVVNARPSEAQSRVEGPERDTDWIDLEFTANPKMKVTRSRAVWNATAPEIRSKWTVVNARPAPVGPPPINMDPAKGPVGAHPTDAHASTGWLDLRDEATANLPAYQAPGEVGEAPGQRDILQAQQILAQGEWVPGTPLQPIDDQTAEAMFSPENLQAAIPAGGLSPLYPSQGDLQTPARWAACGPVAIMALAASKGISITEQQAIAAARKAGWTPETGMRGPASQVRALQEIGISAEMGSPTDVQRIRASIRAGDPVTLSSPGENGHYFVVENIDEYGRMDLGNTVTALGITPRLPNGQKQREFTLQEMRQKLGSYGQVDTAIFVKNPNKPSDSVLASSPGVTAPGPSTRVQSPTGVPGAQISGIPEATIAITKPAEGTEFTTAQALENLHQTQAPLNTILTIAGIQQDDPQIAARTHDWVIEAVGNWLQGDENASWAEPYLNDVARLAYMDEERTNGRITDPRMTPSAYINAWKDGFYGGDENVPLVRQLRRELGLGGPGQYRITVPREYLSPTRGPGSPTPTSSAAPERMSSATGQPRGPIPPYLKGGWQPGKADRSQDVHAYLKEAAQEQGIDIDQVMAVMHQEGSRWDSVGRFNTGTSYGPLQLHYAGGPNPQAGMGDRFTRDTGIDLRRSTSVADHQAAIDYALRELKKKGTWEEWYGADKAFPGRGRFTPVKLVPVSAPVQQAPRDADMNVMLRQMSNRNGSTYQDPDGLVPRGEPRFPVDYRPPPTYDWEGIDRTNDPLMHPPSTIEIPEPEIEMMRSGRPRDTRIAMMQSPTSRMSDIFAQADRDSYPTEGPQPQTGQVGDMGLPSRSDPRIQAAAQESVWSSAQPARQGLMVEYNARPLEERERLFVEALDAGLRAEGIEGAEAERWKRALYEIATGTGRLAGIPGENPDLNPFMIAGESGGKPGTASRMNSSATGYFQLIDSKPDGSDYAFRGYLPKEYGRNVYDPVGQVRQAVRAIQNSTYRGNPDLAVNDKRTRRDHTWNLIVQKVEPW